MHLLLSLSTIVLLSLIAYQDFRSRAVSWIFFPLLAIIGYALAYLDQRSASLQVTFFLFNISFLAIQFALLKVYFFLKGDKTASVMNKRLGWGDVLFLAATCFYFSPLNFILFYILSLIFSIVIFLILSSGRKTILSRDKMTVPLAGLQAAFLCLYLAASYSLPFSLTNDNWLMSKLLN